MVGLTIINESPGVKRQVRARELELSKIKSHAAKASHKKTAKRAVVFLVAPGHVIVSDAEASTDSSRARHTRRTASNTPFLELDRSEEQNSEQETDHGVTPLSQCSEGIVQFLRPAEMLQLSRRSHWQWGHGLRQDPFDCIPGSRFGKDAPALDLCTSFKSFVSVHLIFYSATDH